MQTMSGMKLASEQTLSAARALRHTGFPTVYFSQGFCMVMEDFTVVLWGSFRFRVSLELIYFYFPSVFLRSFFNGLYKSDQKNKFGSLPNPYKGSSTTSLDSQTQRHQVNYNIPTWWKATKYCKGRQKRGF